MTQVETRETCPAGSGEEQDPRNHKSEIRKLKVGPCQRGPCWRVLEHLELLADNAILYRSGAILRATKPDGMSQPAFPDRELTIRYDAIAAMPCEKAR